MITKPTAPATEPAMIGVFEKEEEEDLAKVVSLGRGSTARVVPAAFAAVEGALVAWLGFAAETLLVVGKGEDTEVKEAVMAEKMADDVPVGCCIDAVMVVEGSTDTSGHPPRWQASTEQHPRY